MSVARGKYHLVAERLSRRIQSGDYHIQGVPAERELATQVGVSYTTIRKAIQKLLDAGLLYRQANGRLAATCGEESRTSQKQIAVLVPAWESNEATIWQSNIAQLRSRFNYGSRPLRYVHWDDPILFSTIQQFDAVFLLPMSEPVPDGLIQTLLKPGKPLVVLNRDWTAHGVRSVRLTAPAFIHKLLDHLAALGHHKIDCFNVQPHDAVIQEWLSQWQIWRGANGLSGDLLDHPVEPYTETLDAAYQAIDRRIAEGSFNTRAMFCTTETAAIGATRALIDNGLRPGVDVAIATIGSIRCEYLSPSLTTLETPDPKPYLAACLEQMFKDPATPWAGPLLIQPADLKVVVRESTVPGVRESARRKGRTTSRGEVSGLQ